MRSYVTLGDFEPPAGCPRRLDGGDGPRACSITACSNHLKVPGKRGRLSAARVRALASSPDDCAFDVIARVKAEGHELTFDEIGALDGVSGELVRQAFWRAIAKMKKKLGF